MNTATDSLKTNTPKTGGGMEVGQSTSDLVGFWGVTPVVQPVGAAQAAITDSSGGAASATTGVQALTSTYNSTLLGNALATVIAQGNALRAALVSSGIIKGGA